MDRTGEGSGLSQVDAADLLGDLSASDRAAVQDAWRRPEPVAADGVLAAVAVPRVRSHLRFSWFYAVLWSFWVVSLFLGRSRTVVIVLALGLTAGVWWSVLRGRRSLRRLAAVADVEGAHARAVELRRERHAARH